MDPLFVQTLLTFVHPLQVSRYMDLASIVVMLYEYCITFDLEVKYIWLAPWNKMKIIFLVSRYSPFLDLGFLFYGLFAINASVGICSTATKFHAFMFGSSICISDAIFTARTWSVWQRGRAFTIGLTVLFIMTWSTCMVFVGIFIISLQNIPSPYPWINGCFIIGGNASVFTAFCVLFIAYNAVTFALMAIRGYNAYQSGGQSNLFKVVCQDGISYYLYALALAFADIILALELPHEYINLMVSMSRTIHAILACRVILHIRECASTGTILQQNSHYTQDDISRIRFKSVREAESDIYTTV